LLTVKVMGERVYSKALRFFLGLGLFWAVFLLGPVAAVAADNAPSYRLTNGQTVAPLELFRECEQCPEMVVLPTGSFVMGAPLAESELAYLLWLKPKPGEPVGMVQEGPQHEVIIDVPIAMGRNEVTRAEWLACVEDGGCTHVPDPRILALRGYFYADDPRSPVIDVSYRDMLEYVAWLNRLTGTEAYRLPIEAEWEYAARAGTRTRFAQGDSLTVDQANIAVFRREGDRSVPDPNNRKIPVPVDMLDAANAWGLRHMAGNVVELTMSCWSKRHLGLPTSSAYLAEARNSGTCPHVAKGGSFGRSGEYARPANRGSTSETSRSVSVGFRIVREL
jgi:formylglycine-generating enzyme required for sulfatase activity